MDARSVTDQFEWSSLARQAPSFTHEWSWSQLCAHRIRILTFQKVSVLPVYLRVWHGDHLIGCPAMVLSETDAFRATIITPRARPAVLIDGGGEPVDPMAALTEGVPDLTVETAADPLGNHQHLLDEVTVSRSRSWSLTERDLAGIRSAACWPDDHERDVWVRWIIRFWRASGWRAELVTHRSGSGGIVGWAIRAHRSRGVETAAVLVNGTTAHPWMSHRLRS